jgi:O-antigen/teichoic acid export membrane protein
MAAAGLLRSLNWVVAANAIAGVINFFSLAWFARRVGAASMGDYALVVTVVQLIASVLSAGFDQAVIRMPKDRDIAAAAGIATVIQSVLLVAISGFVYLYFFLHSSTESARLFGAAWLIVAAIIITFFANLLAAPIAAEMDYRFLSAARLISTLLGLALGVSLAISAFGVYSLACRDAFGAVVMLLLCRFRRRSGLPWLTNRAGVRRLMQFTKGLWTLNVMERLVFRIDYGIVGLIFGKDVLGIYFVIRGLVEGILGFLVTPIQTVLFSHYCGLDETFQQEPGQQRRVGCTYVATGAAVAALAWIFAHAAIGKLLGPRYADGSVLVPGLVIYAAGILWFEYVKVRAMSQYRHNKLVYARMLQMGAFVVLIFPCAYLFGIGGAGLATGAGGAVLAFSSYRLYEGANRNGLWERRNADQA